MALASRDHLTLDHIMDQIMDRIIIISAITTIEDKEDPIMIMDFTEKDTIEEVLMGDDHLDLGNRDNQTLLLITLYNKIIDLPMGLIDLSRATIDPKWDTMDHNKNQDGIKDMHLLRDSQMR